MNEQHTLPLTFPDARWPSDNEWGIPTLDITKPATAVDKPFYCWGTSRRHGKAIAPGTVHFYTDDSRFTALINNPGPVVKTQCVNVVEPNFSVYGQSEIWQAAMATGQKRTLARQWQWAGIDIFVDLNVARVYSSVNLLGVPRGWQAYATRAYIERLEDLDFEYSLAKEHANDLPLLFVVYGGGKVGEAWAKRHGSEAVHFYDTMTEKRNE